MAGLDDLAPGVGLLVEGGPQVLEAPAPEPVLLTGQPEGLGGDLGGALGQAQALVLVLQLQERSRTSCSVRSSAARSSSWRFRSSTEDRWMACWFWK